MTAPDSPASRTRDPMAFEPPYHTSAAADVSDEFESPGAGPRPRGESFDDDPDWERVGLFGAGIFVGALLGVGAALLFAPRSGEATRAAIGSRFLSARGQAGDMWEDLGETLQRAARRTRRNVRRRVTRSRWAAEDAIAT